MSDNVQFQIGDKVIVAKHNKEAIIEDVLYSNKTDDWMYVVRFADSPYPFARPMNGDELLSVVSKSYRWEVSLTDNVVVAVMYEIDGDIETEIARQHGHIMHEGLIGVAQAASYAMKRIYIGMNDGKYIGMEGDQYVR